MDQSRWVSILRYEIARAFRTGASCEEDEGIPAIASTYIEYRLAEIFNVLQKEKQGENY